MRVTRKFLDDAVRSLNMILERPLTPMDDKWNIGNLHIEKDIGGYSLSEIVSNTGSTVKWSAPGLSMKEISLFINGVHAGLALRNAHLNVQLFRGDGHPLYR